MTMARQKQIINRTWAPASHLLAGGDVIDFYVNLRRADGLVALNRAGAYRLGAVFGMDRNEEGDLAVIQLDVYRGSSRADAEKELEQLAREVSGPVAGESL